MVERLLFLTGHLARARLEKLITGLVNPDFVATIFDMGVKVAALMTQDIILRRLPRGIEADRVIIPGRCRADLAVLSHEFGIPFQRGPDELQDLPAFLGRRSASVDLSRHNVRIFAEIVDASALNLMQLHTRASAMRADGADVIDLGCLPDTPFLQLEAMIDALHRDNCKVSVDSANPSELRRAALAGADYLLSLNEFNLDIVAGTKTIPILVPAKHGDLDSLLRAAERAASLGLRPILDPILDPIHFGFTASLSRYQQLRTALPNAEILMGTGNLTELTEADSGGVTAMLMGVISELDITNVLVVHVSPHTVKTVTEHDAARRLMYAAKQDHALPKGYNSGLMQLHDKTPFTATALEISMLAKQIKDKNFRIETAKDGIHVYNNNIHAVSQSAMELFPQLEVQGDGAHAFYLGSELQKAEIAWRLGKRYTQDEPLDWGVADVLTIIDKTKLKGAGHTLRAAKLGRIDKQ